MDREHERRLAQNEAVFRGVNEQIKQLADRHGSADAHRYEFICECSTADCTERIELTLAEYERIRGEPDRFVLAPGHEIGEIEIVVERKSDHVVVEKQGEAARTAVALDPRGDPPG